MQGGRPVAASPCCSAPPNARGCFAVRSRSVLIRKTFGPPIAYDDGVTIAREVELPDPEENLGAQLPKQAAIKTGEAVGDGASIATIFAQAILADGIHRKP